MSESWTPEENGPPYLLGHSDQELRRLRLQSHLIEPFTRQLLVDAGLGAGMRVLDVGSGAGDVAFLAADLVGAVGHVTGSDRSSDAVRSATSSARSRGLTNVTFVEGDPAVVSFDQPFDAVIGRYVLLFQADRPRMLRSLAERVRPGGALVFHEPDWSFVRSTPAAPTYDECCRWIVEAGRRSGSPWEMAGQLHAAFIGAGLPVPSMRLHALIGTGETVHPWLESVADIVRVLLSSMEDMGVTTAAEANVSTLYDRMRHEIDLNGSVVVGRAEIGAWCRVPGHS